MANVNSPANPVFPLREQDVYIALVITKDGHLKSVRDASLAETTCQIRLDALMSLPSLGLPTSDYVVTVSVNSRGQA